MLNLSLSLLNLNTVLTATLYLSDNLEYDVITPEGFLITKAAISIEQASKVHPYHALSQAPLNISGMYGERNIWPIYLAT